MIAALTLIMQMKAQEQKDALAMKKFDMQMQKMLMDSEQSRKMTYFGALSDEDKAKIAKSEFGIGNGKGSNDKKNTDVMKQVAEKSQEILDIPNILKSTAGSGASEWTKRRAEEIRARETGNRSAAIAKSLGMPKVKAAADSMMGVLSEEAGKIPGMNVADKAVSGFLNKILVHAGLADPLAWQNDPTLMGIQGRQSDLQAFATPEERSAENERRIRAGLPLVGF